jgi:hypothetical protein
MTQERQENRDLVISNVATSEVCAQSGVYRSTSTPPIILFIFKGDTFPNAPTSTSANGAPTTWNLLTATSSVASSDN